MEKYRSILKKEMDTLAYDLSFYCKSTLKENPYPFPDELTDIEKSFKKYASMNPPEPLETSCQFRAYIFDNQLNMLFAMETNSGQIPQKIGRMLHKTKSFANYAYGSGEKFDSVFFTRDASRFCKEFNQSYGFIPVENYILPMYLWFDTNEICRSEYVSPYQLAFILLKFKKYNLVNWENITNSFDFSANGIEPPIML